MEQVPAEFVQCARAGTLFLEHFMSNAIPDGMVISGPVDAAFSGILSADALSLVARLHRSFEGRRRELMGMRAQRQKQFDAGALPDFLAETRAIRESEWTIAKQPPDLLDRRVEITGPTDRKMVINRSEEHTSELQSH